jgi:mono/diheme cytochrome c family protein
MRFRLKKALLIPILSSALTAFAAANGGWLKNVPVRDHERTNPYKDQPEAMAGSKRIFEQNCSPCHGRNAEGTKKRPPLRSERVQHEATEGDIHWLLVNGNMRKGMPSWAKLPDQQLWQVIAYVKSLGQ